MTAPPIGAKDDLDSNSSEDVLMQTAQSCLCAAEWSAVLFVLLASGKHHVDVKIA